MENAHLVVRSLRVYVSPPKIFTGILNNYVVDFVKDDLVGRGCLPIDIDSTVDNGYDSATMRIEKISK